MPQWAKKDRFLLSHFYTCLAHPKLQLCFIATKIFKIKFLAQLLTKQKEKHKLYPCWANGFENWLLFGLQLPLQNKVSADSVEEMAEVKWIIWLTISWSTRRIGRVDILCFIKGSDSFKLTSFDVEKLTLTSIIFSKRNIFGSLFRNLRVQL